MLEAGVPVLDRNLRNAVFCPLSLTDQSRNMGLGTARNKDHSAKRYSKTHTDQLLKNRAAKSSNTFSR